MVDNVLDPELLIAVDYDGTLTDALGEPDETAIGYVRQMQAMGARIILHTCRGGDALIEAIATCASRGLSFDFVNEDNGKRNSHVKPNADFYIDDRAWVGPIDWEKVYNHVQRLAASR